MPCLRFRYFLRCQHLIRRFGYADIFVVPARLGKGGGLFPFLARTLTLPDDVELLGALTPRVCGAACSATSLADAVKARTLTNFKKAPARSVRNTRMLEPFYPYEQRAIAPCHCTAASFKTAHELPTKIDAENANTVSAQISFQHQLLATEANPKKNIFSNGKAICRRYQQSKHTNYDIRSQLAAPPARTGSMFAFSGIGSNTIFCGGAASTAFNTSAALEILKS